MQKSDEQQDVLVVSGDGEPLRRIESYIRENIGENHIFRVDSLKEAAAVMQRTDLEILVADRGRILREGKDISWEDSFEPTRGNAKEDIRYVLLYIREHYAEDLSLARIAGWILWKRRPFSSSPRISACRIWQGGSATAILPISAAVFVSFTA